MAQDIRYPGVRVGEACGPWTALLAGVEDRKIYAYHYHYHYHTIPYHTIMGLSHYPSRDHGLELWPCMGRQWHKPNLYGITPATAMASSYGPAWADG